MIKENIWDPKKIQSIQDGLRMQKSLLKLTLNGSYTVDPVPIYGELSRIEKRMERNRKLINIWQILMQNQNS